MCGKGVGANSVKCTKCQLWVHGKCSGVQKSLSTVKDTFVCKKCSSGTRVSKDEIVDKDDQRLDIGSGVILEKVSSFCYLGDVLDAGGGVDSAVTARLRYGWKKFRDLTPILMVKGASLRLKGRLYESCVRSAMLYGSEAWAVKVEHVRKLERTEMRMVRLICGVSLKERKTNAELRGRMGIEEISTVLRRN